MRYDILQQNKTLCFFFIEEKTNDVKLKLKINNDGLLAH